MKTAKEEPAAESPPNRWAFMRAVQGTWMGVLLDDHKFNVYGWTQMSYNASTASGSNLPLAMDDRANEFLVNQNFLHFERTIDTSKREYQLGFATEWILPGSDYRFTLPRGLWNSQLTSNNGTPELYGVDAFQAYVQAFLPNLGPRGTKVIAGRFATHVGYELVQAADTPFVSRSYMFEYNPFTHSGVWATTQLNDTWSIGNGIATGSDTFFDQASRATYLGQLKWAPPNGRSTAALNVVITNPKFDANEAFPFYNFYNLLYTYKLSERANYILDCGYANMRDVPGIGATDWYGAANYLTYKFNNQVTGTLRAEVFEDTDGVRTGFAGFYYEVTAGVAYSPIPSLILKPHVRYDYNANTAAFEGDRYLVTAAFEAIIRW